MCLHQFASKFLIIIQSHHHPFSSSSNLITSSSSILITSSILIIIHSHSHHLNKSHFLLQVIHNILSEDEISATIEEIWYDVETKGSGVDREDPSTWGNSHFPWGAAIGMVGGDPTIGKQAWRNRIKPELYKAFSFFSGHKELRVSVDRYGMLRPTKNVEMKNENGEVEIKDMEEWRTALKSIHWDLNPWYYHHAERDEEVKAFEEGRNKFFGGFSPGSFLSEFNDAIEKQDKHVLQGLIAITDAREEDGGFHTVSGFSSQLEKWTKINDQQFEQEKFNTTFVQVPKDDEMRRHVQRIPLRAGSLLIWDSRQPHSNYANESENIRMVQYVKMFPEPEFDEEYEDGRLKMLSMMIPKSLMEEEEREEFQTKILGLERWDGQKPNSGKNCVIQ
eukprot:TRINITY_DN879_c0_g1_i1.p1 TRINITY_DN879_c0_g1~~TRINITY_DN879_c0_g1_i1.p1  ORF type:complete len:391 (+),score=114.56 TRINITY_DN879_c0_g1_i1:167-1339(+)